MCCRISQNMLQITISLHKGVKNKGRVYLQHAQTLHYKQIRLTGGFRNCHQHLFTVGLQHYRFNADELKNSLVHKHLNTGHNLLCLKSLGAGWWDRKFKTNESGVENVGVQFRYVTEKIKTFFK